MRRRLALALPAVGALLGSVVTSSPAVAAQNPPMQAQGLAAVAALTTADGANVSFYVNQATNHQPGGAPTNSSLLDIERSAQSCDSGDYFDGTNTCTFSYTRVSLFPLDSRTLDVGPALTSATLPTITAPYQRTECTDAPDVPETCTETSGVTDVTASFTATGPLDNSIYHERYDGYDGCRNTLLSSSRGRTADASFTFLGSTYRTTGRIGENVQLARQC
jgi:hypothetical protein